MLHFGIYFGQKKVKTLRAKQMNTIYVNYNKYCREKGFSQQVQHANSFGHVAWCNTNQQCLLLVPELN